MIFPSTLRLTFFLALLTIASSTPVSAQQIAVDKQKRAHINLNNLHHIDLLQQMGGLSAERRKTKLIKEKEGWQAFITINDWNNDSITLVKKIPVHVLDSLMALIANPAPTIDYRLFKLEENLLISEMDINSKYELSPDQRAVFIDSFRSPTALNAAIKKAFMPFPMDDQQTYRMTLVNNEGEKFTLEARSLADPYHLPWKGNGFISFNPELGLLFAFIMDDQKYAAAQKDRIHRRIVSGITGFKRTRNFFSN